MCRNKHVVQLLTLKMWLGKTKQLQFNWVKRNLLEMVTVSLVALLL